MKKVALIYTAIGLTMAQFLSVQAYREHKVHNIVLYPDKHSWCKTTTIKQVISYPGCTSVEIENNVCVGACFSYSIPHTEPSDPGEVIVPYCDSCQPSETIWHQITLQCNKNDADTPSQLIKHVQIIQNCSCTSCEKDSLRLTKFPDNNEEELLLQQNADSEILDALLIRNETSYNHLESDRWKKMHLFLNQKLVTLLKNIQANNSDHDKEQLFDLFNAIQEPMKQKVKAKNIIDFIETLQNNQTEFDTPRLTELLLKFEHSKHHKMGKEINEIQEKPTKNVEATISEDLHSSLNVTDSRADKEDITKNEENASNLPIDVWLPNAYDSKSERSVQHTASSSEVSAESLPILTHAHEHRQHQDVSEISAEKDLTSEHHVGEEVHHHLHSHSHTHPHQHHLNDNIVSHGHLTRGPHGALVIEPDRIHEKLDVNAHELKPNHAGTLLSYHSHSGEGNART